jgi:hypothetical protein
MKRAKNSNALWATAAGSWIEINTIEMKSRSAMAKFCAVDKQNEQKSK